MSRYTFTSESVSEGHPDKVSDRIGFRTIETKAGQILLNGRPFYLRAALDQDYYPELICTPPSQAYIEDQFRKAKEMGLNCLRVHIKVPDPRYYEVADRLGLLVWTEVPNVANFTSASARRMRETMEGILKRDRNHPSIIAWTLINEDWGTRLVENAAAGRHAELVAQLRALSIEHPVRENLRAQLMLALVRSGRQAEALRAFQRTRARCQRADRVDGGRCAVRQCQSVAQHGIDTERTQPGTIADGDHAYLRPRWYPRQRRQCVEQAVERRTLDQAGASEGGGAYRVGTGQRFATPDATLQHDDRLQSRAGARQGDRHRAVPPPRVRGDVYLPDLRGTGRDAGPRRRRGCCA